MQEQTSKGKRCKRGGEKHERGGEKHERGGEKHERGDSEPEVVPMHSDGGVLAGSDESLQVM